MSESELIKISAITIIMVPIEPYNALYRPKLFTNAEKPRVAIMLNVVAKITPGELNLHLFCMEGIYRKINPMAKNMSNTINIHRV